MSKRSYERRIRAKREAQRAERKRAVRMHKFRVWSSAGAAVAIAVVLLIVFLGGNDKKKPSASPTTAASATPIAGCTVPAPPPTPNGKTFKTAPAMTVDKDKIYLATLQTSCGNIIMRMDPRVDAATVNNFVFLARQGFYDNTKFGRVQNDPGFGLIQAGTQTGGISGGVDYTYAGATPPPGTKYSRGVVAMAHGQTGLSNNGSQFFIVVTSADSLNQTPDYSILGKVEDASSLATLDKIIQAKGPEVQPGQSLGVTPDPPIYILKVTVAEQKR